ncbi:nuclear transport factor 2 family protein [Streptomyces sp. NPDC058464]|uniref:nuclear transport factor 2 family protein n=1 Tax=Streptomyces sp. NPDC058464 TaxID=3346511 RepID=UPI0036608F46
MSTETSHRIVRRVLAEGDFVVNHSIVVGDSGPAAVRFDLWRNPEGGTVEHWSDEEAWVPATVNGYSQIDGVTAVDHSADPEETRRIATETVQNILVEGKTAVLGDYLAGEDYVQHNPRFADGVSGLVAALTALAEQGVTMSYDGIRQVVVEGDFAYLRSEGSFAGTPFVFHDLFRVAGGKCVEHWDVMVPRS